MVFAGFVIALVRLVIQAQRRRATTGAEGLVGSRGRAETALDPEGWVQRPGRAAGGRRAGERDRAPARRISVVSMDGLALRVQKEA